MCPTIQKQQTTNKNKNKTKQNKTNPKTNKQTNPVYYWLIMLNQSLQAVYVLVVRCV